MYASIIRELHRYRDKISANTLYMGGGTPSLVPVNVLAELFDGVRIDENAEVTLEANPSSVTREKAEQWRKLGINRLSVGLQSMDDSRLAWLGRVHDKRVAMAALEVVLEAGFKSLSVDFIVGIPGLSARAIEQELGGLLDAFPAIDHVSAYLLTLKPGNPKYDELPDEDAQLDHLRATSRLLTGSGFEHYEVSNFARPGRRARHNESYWLGKSYLGIGPSAHSYDASEKRRWKNCASLEKYAAELESGAHPIEWSERLSRDQERIEYLMLRLRRADGLSLIDYRTRFGDDLLADNRLLFESWQRYGLCVVDGTVRLTSNGFFLSDQLLTKLI